MRNTLDDATPQGPGEKKYPHLIWSQDRPQAALHVTISAIRNGQPFGRTRKITLTREHLFTLVSDALRMEAE